MSESQPYWIVDILPRQVPAAAAGQYGAVERFLREPVQAQNTYARMARLLLKLNCYYDLHVAAPSEEAPVINPAPEALDRLVRSLPQAAQGTYELTIEIPAEGATLALDGNDHYFTLYQPSPDLLQDLRELAHAEGLFVWQPPH